MTLMDQLEVCVINAQRRDDISQTPETFAAHARAQDEYGDLCDETLTCTAIGCRNHSEWCVSCDDHCAQPGHVPHAECRDDE